MECQQCEQSVFYAYLCNGRRQVTYQWQPKALTPNDKSNPVLLTFHLYTVSLLRDASKYILKCSKYEPVS